MNPSHSTEVKKKMSKLPVENPKPTAATLLREESVFLRKEKEEAEVKKKKIIELRDDTEFKEWQARMQSEDERIAKAAVSQRKVDMMLADEEARAARRREEQKRGKIAARIKEDLSAEVENMKQEQGTSFPSSKFYSTHLWPVLGLHRVILVLNFFFPQQKNFKTTTANLSSN